MTDPEEEYSEWRKARSKAKPFDRGLAEVMAVGSGLAAVGYAVYVITKADHDGKAVLWLILAVGVVAGATAHH